MSYTLTTSDVARILEKSEKTVQRYIKNDRLHPQLVKGERGILENRFDTEEVEKLKAEIPQAHIPETSKTDTSDETSKTPKEDRTNYDVLSQTIQTLTGQLAVKDEQIAQLNERLRESHIMQNTLQERVSALLPSPAPSKDMGDRQDGQRTQDRADVSVQAKQDNEDRHDTQDRQDSFWRRHFPTFFK